MRLFHGNITLIPSLVSTSGDTETQRQTAGKKAFSPTMATQSTRMTTIDATALNPASQNSTTIQNPAAYRRAIQKGNYFSCDVCWHTYPNNLEFNVHICPSDTFSLPQPPVCQPGVPQTSDLHSSFSENSVIQTLTQVSVASVEDHQSLSQTSGLDVGVQMPCSLQTDQASALPTDHTETVLTTHLANEKEFNTNKTGNGEHEDSDRKYGKKLPILLPDFSEVVESIMKNTTTKCEDCGKDFPSPEELINHMKKHTGGNIFKCNECPSVFTLKESWRRHSRRHLQETPSVCTVCGVLFQRSDSCTAHMRTHFGKKAHSCEHCHKVFAYRKDFTIHMRIHTGERPYECTECDAAFAQKGHLTRHLKTHTGDRPHKCDECGACFSIRYRLIEHWRTHTGERPYSCDLCEASFSHRNTLKFHKRKHTGEKPFKCNYCEAKFSHQTHLVVHTRRHTGERPYKCNTCQASYARKNLLVIHTRKHTGERPFKCTQCSAAFAQRNYLKDHLRTHTGEKPFECDICHMFFSQRTSLRLHKKSHLSPHPKKSSHRSRKEGSTLDRMISSLAKKKQHQSKLAREAAEALEKKAKADKEVNKMASKDTKLDIEPQVKDTSKNSSRVLRSKGSTKITADIDAVVELEVDEVDGCQSKEKPKGGAKSPMITDDLDIPHSPGKRSRKIGRKPSSPIKLKLKVPRS